MVNTDRYLTYLLTLFFCFLCLLAIGCDGAATAGQGSVKNAKGYVTAISVSSDGRNAISSHADNQIILWDISNKSKKVISRNGNIFSAYFAKQSDRFIWQDLDDVVHVYDIGGNEILKFKHIPTYGHIITPDLEHYFSSDIGWAIYHRSKAGDIKKIKNDWGKAYLGFGKLLNLSMSPNFDFLLQSGSAYEFDGKVSLNDDKKKNYAELSGVALWNTTTLTPLAKLPGNAAKTYATFSPDGKYVVSGDENGIGFVWDLASDSPKFRLASLFHGVYIGEGKDLEGLYGEALAKAAYDKTGLIKPPRDYHGEAVISFKFIDTQYHYLRFTKNQHYAILYTIDSPLPLKYLSLGKIPFPAVSDYARNTAIDAAPEAGILVTGQRDGTGINVYQFDEEKLELKKIWVTE